MAEDDDGERLEDTIWREIEEMCAKYDGCTWTCSDGFEHCWQLFVYGPPPEEGWSAFTAQHGMQVLKAAKKGTPYAEYWPDSNEQRYIMAALNGLPLLLKRVKELEREVSNLHEASHGW